MTNGVKRCGRRINITGDLIAAEARYYHKKCYLPYTNNRAGINSTSRKSIGRKSLLHKTEHFEKLLSYLKDNEEC